MAASSNVDALAAGRQPPGALGHLPRQAVDVDVAEQPLGVRLRGGERDRQVRQAGTDHDQRRALLADLVAGPADRGELLGGDVLHLVDVERDADAEVAGQRGHVAEQLDQVELEVARVGAALDRDGVDRRRPAHALAVGQLGTQRERLEHAGHRLDAVGVAVPVGDFADRGVHCLRDRDPDALVGARLDLAGAPGPLHRLAAQRVEQHGLADAAQSREHHAPLGPAGRHPLQGDLELLQLPVATGQLRRPLTCSWGVRIADRVHVSTVSAYLPFSLD